MRNMHMNCIQTFKLDVLYINFEETARRLQVSFESKRKRADRNRLKEGGAHVWTYFTPSLYTSPNFAIFVKRIHRTSQLACLRIQQFLWSELCSWAVLLTELLHSLPSDKCLDINIKQTRMLPFDNSPFDFRINKLLLNSTLRNPASLRNPDI
jgi:hypothetical protein